MHITPSLLKIHRFSAWLLVIVTPLVIFSGFYAAKNYLSPGITPATARTWHQTILPLVFFVIFYAHTCLGIIMLSNRHTWLRHGMLQTIIVFVWTALFAIFAWYYFANAPTNQERQTAAYTSTQGDSSAIQLTQEEIARHQTAQDCWLIINGMVYDVTSFFSSHPGGAGTITPYCGKEGSNAFATKDAGAPHSNRANLILGEYLLGGIGSLVPRTTLEMVKSLPPPLLDDADNE
jgi:cytochrome b involved in lipid metabolism